MAEDKNKATRTPRVEELPNQVASDDMRKDGIIRAVQANFDHLMGGLRAIARGHNRIVDDVEAQADTINIIQGDVDTAITIGETHTHTGGDGSSSLNIPLFFGGDADDGPPGAPGRIGSDGAAGAAGADGVTTTILIPGKDGDDAEGFIVFPGSAGPTGATGAAGAAGAGATFAGIAKFGF